jgi:hypothetical protein
VGTMTMTFGKPRVGGLFDAVRMLTTDATGPKR